jgi:catechol 2,3-dioxygenase
LINFNPAAHLRLSPIPNNQSPIPENFYYNSSSIRIFLAQFMIPMENQNGKTTPLGYTHLTVSDLDRSIKFYQEGLGLDLVHQQNGSAVLGVGETALLKVTAKSDAVVAMRSTGLYHFALRVPSRVALASFVKHLIDTQTPVQGVADHHVSEAIYLPDPDGNGIEVYHDRSRQDWYDPDGNLILTTDPLDLDGLLADLPNGDDVWQGLSSGTVLGHIHLHVADLGETEHFYREVMGMDLVAEYGGSALFFSWDGYHHHVGANTWNGQGAPAPPADAIGLRYFTLHIDEKRLKDIRSRFDADGIDLIPSQGGWFVHDPAGNGLELHPQGI